MTMLRAAAIAWCIALSLVAACGAQNPAPDAEMDSMDSTDQHATQAAHEAMSGPMGVDPHLTLTPVRPGGGSDSIRAAQFVAQMRTALDRYRDVRVAGADGYRKFLPGTR
jgi:hypothetical protein